MHFNAERVAMQPAAFVARRYIRQQVGGFKRELFVDFHGGGTRDGAGMLISGLAASQGY